MSKHCGRYPNCGCPPDMGIACHQENYSQEVQDKMNLKYQEQEYQKFLDIHKKHGVFFISKETGAKGGFIFPDMDIPEWITADRIRFTANTNHMTDLNTAIGYRAATKKERNSHGFKRKYYGK